MNSKLYRTDYQGEFVITRTIFRGGKKEQEREWVDNPLTISSENHRACCVANGNSIKKFPLLRLEKHPGGLHHCNKMQLYGVEEMWNQIKTDFTIVQQQDILDEIKKSGEQVDRVIYTTPRLCINNPGEFYMIPHGTLSLSPVTALWLACFDGHKDIYLFGYDPTDERGTVLEKMIHGVARVMKTYDDVNFYHVTNSLSPDAWRRCINLKTMKEREFISACDI